MDTEESLIQRIQRGEYDMFEKIYTTYFDKIYAFIFIKSNGDKTLTEDICSETFMKAFEKLPEFHTEASNFRSWLYTIAYHTFIDFIKQPTLNALSETEAMEENNLLDLFEKKEKTKEILSFLDTLGTDKKDLFLLRIRDQLKYDEIGEILGKTEEACRQEFSRILKKLIQKYHQ